MGAAESNPVRNLDKRTARRTYRDAFRGAVKRYRTSARVAEQWAYLGEEGEKEWDEGALKVCVRKRPIFKPEIQGKEFDVLTVTHNKLITVHDARMHADMRPAPLPPRTNICTCCKMHVRRGALTRGASGAHSR